MIPGDLTDSRALAPRDPIMWRNPKHYPPGGGDQQPAPEPIEPSGTTLAEFPRGQGEKLRVSLESYNGHPFVRLQCWEVGTAGRWWPIRGKSVTVKVRECGRLAEVLADVARDHPAPSPQGRSGASRGARDGGPTVPGQRPPYGANKAPGGGAPVRGDFTGYGGSGPSATAGPGDSFTEV